MHGFKLMNRQPNGDDTSKHLADNDPYDRDLEREALLKGCIAQVFPLVDTNHLHFHFHFHFHYKGIDPFLQSEGILFLFISFALIDHHNTLSNF